tara:strand:- start:15488 stop:15964 length:477 start_codon:yes stop_codon:yes gene_type:complete
MRHLIIGLLFSLSTGASVVKADTIQDILTCRSITAIDARLACFDAVADKIKTPPAVNASPDNAREEAKSNGQKLPQTFGLKEKEGERITQTVTGIKFGPAKQFMITTESGQVWLQSDTQKVKLPRKLPFTVTIERGAMGSYFLNASGQSTQYKARRLK